MSSRTMDYRSTMGRFRRCAAAALIVAGVAAVSARADTIEQLNGQTLDDVEIVRAQWDTIQFRQGRSKSVQSVKGATVASITRAAQSRDLSEARKSLTAGRYADAVRRLERVSSGGQNWEKLEASYLLGRALAEAGKHNEAVTQLQKYVQAAEAEKDWWLPSAVYELGLAQTALGDGSAAATTFKSLEQFGGQWGSRAVIGRARAAIESKAEGQYEAATRALNNVTRDRSIPFALRHEAYTLRSRIFIARKQFDRAIKELDSVFFDSSRVREFRYDSHRAEATYLVGRAHIGLGGRENLQKAEIWFLRVAALYPKEWPIQRRTAAALAKVYESLGNKDRASEWAARARGNES